MLMDHAYARANRVGGRTELEASAVDDDLALVGLVHAVELAHQRALAGPVLSEKGVHLTGIHVEADLRIGLHSREAFDDVQHLDPAGPGRLSARALDAIILRLQLVLSLGAGTRQES